MKRIIAFVFVLILAAAALTACGSNTDSTVTPTLPDLSTIAATDEATEAPTEAETEAPTEAVTEAPTKAPAQETEFTYTDPAGAYQLTVPVIWNGTGLIVEDNLDDGSEIVRFVYKDAYYQGAGHVFSVVYADKASQIVDVTQFPHAEELFNNGQKQVYVIFPTDVQWGVYADQGSSEFNKQNAEYSALAGTRQDIIDSFDPQTL